MVRPLALSTAVCIAWLSAACGSRPAAPLYDLLILNGAVVDGTGRPAYAADVAIQQDRIAAVGDLKRRSARRVIDAAGLTVSPGFIDIHSHSDYTLLVDGTAQSKVRQGVTTEILGEAPSAGPLKGKATLDLSAYGLKADWTTLGEYFQRLEKAGTSVNTGSFVGATQVRQCVLGQESREPTPNELGEMTKLVTEAMQDGAFGLSSSLIVPPDTYLTTNELVALAAAVKRFGGIYSTHIRGEGKTVFEAVREAISIGERAGVPVDIIHLKIADKQLWGQMNRVRDLIEEARRRGQQVTANQYPYVAGQNFLIAFIPPWAMEGGLPKLLERLRNPALRARMKRDIYQGIDGWFDHYQAIQGWQSIIVAEVRNEKNKLFEGKSVADIAGSTGKEATDVIFDLILEDRGPVSAVFFLMSEDDVRFAMRIPWVSVGSDGEAVRPDGLLGRGKPHPRWYGTFPRILGKYVREEKVLPLEEAVRKMTSLNAAKLGMEDRGVLAEGKLADIAIFDAGRVIDKATFENPHQYAEGIEYVVVNGTLVLEKGKHLGTRPGRIVYGKGRRASAATLRLKVVDEDGAPASARVRILDAEGRPAVAHLLAALPVAAHPNFPELGVTVVHDARVAVPAGKLLITADRGPEYQRASLPVDVGVGETLEQTISLRRWTDMAAKGWWSGDLHVHRAPEDLPALMDAADLHFAPAITCFNDAPPLIETMAPPIPEAGARRIYSIDNCEDERRWGAALFIGVKSPMSLYPRQSEYPPPAQTWAEARRRGAFVDLEKAIWWESPVMAALDPPDSIGVAVNHFLEDTVSTRASLARPRDESKYGGPGGFAKYIMDLYATYLSAGFRIPASAGSANGVTRNALGYNRSYVQLGSQFTYQDWMAGQKAGRNFVTNGPMLSFRVNSQLPGAVLAENTGEAAVEVECESREALDRVDIIADGENVAVFPAKAGDSRIAASQRVAPHAGGWITARCFEKDARTVRFAHSSPVYFGPSARRDPAALRYLRDWVDAEMARIEKAPADSLSPPQKQELLALCRKARLRYE